MNRILHLFDSPSLPSPAGPFSDGEAWTLLQSYDKDPSSVVCPTCGPGHIEVLAFVEIVTGEDGFSQIVEPEGKYAAALYCHSCSKAVGIQAWTLIKD